MRANNIRKGNVLLLKGAPCKVLSFTHVTPGKGQAVVQCKFRNLITGVQGETRFGATENVETADVYTAKATYLYADGENYNFMDSSTYEQFALSKEILDTAVYYLQDNMEIEVTSFEEKPIGIQIPQSVILTVTETEPELKGATANNSPKPATTDTGLTLNVPPFVKEGDRIQVNTETGEYIGRE